MSDISPALTDPQRAFLETQPAFFVATAGEGGRIDLFPKAMAGFRVLRPDLVGYLDADGAEQADLTIDGRITIMICATDRPSQVLRLHGRGRAILPDDDEWDIAARHFTGVENASRIVMIGLDRVEEGAGWSGPAALGKHEAPGRIDRHADVAPDWVPAVLNFWLGEVGPDGWFDSSEEMDVRLTHLFRALWEAQKTKPASAFLADADTALAAIILFDQFPRNMFRHEARAFETDALALDIARAAIERGYDDEFVAGARAFFYIPFMHSERLADQDRCVQLFSEPGFEDNLRFAKMHRDVIARFGRFPHRNKALGRATLPEEEPAVAEGADW